eukprot:853350-Rhodomonas_salina.2
MMLRRIRRWPMVLCYAASGTDLHYGATRAINRICEITPSSIAPNLVRPVPYRPAKSPVLTYNG